MSQGRINWISSTPISSRQSRFTPSSFSNSHASISTASLTNTSDEDQGPVLLDEESNVESSVPSVQVPNRGQDWNELKSRHDDRIYYMVIMNPFDTMRTAEDWASLLKENRRKAVHSFFRFITDLCNFQQVSIENLDYAQIARLVGNMEQNPSCQLESTGRYLMNTTSAWGRQSQKAVLNFICQAIKAAEDCEPLTEELLKEILKYLHCLSQSEMTVLKHTSVVIAARMITGFINVIDTFNQELQTSFESPELLIVKRKIDNRVVQIEKIIALLLNIFEHVCAIYYNKPVKMPLDCLREMGRWIKKYPEIISPKTKCARLSRRYLSHPASEVRLQAISFATNMLHMPVNDYLKELILKLCPQIQDMFLDVGYDVAVKAVEFFTVLLSDECRKSYYFEPNIQDCFLMTINKNYPLALAAGKYLISYIRCLDMNTDKSRLIVCLLQILLRKGMKKWTALFVESIIDCTPELTMWELIFGLLRGSDLKENDKNVLQEMFCCTVHQILAGCSLKREKQETAPKSSIVIKDTSQMYLQNFNFLMENYAARNPVSAIQIIDLLKLINYDKLSNDVCKENLHKITNQLKIIINNTNNMEVIKAACEALNVFCKSSKEMVKNRGRMVIQTITEKLWATYVSLFEEYKRDFNDETAAALKDILIPLSILHEVFDLTGEIHWNELFSMWTEVADESLNNKCAQFHLTTCLHSLKWRIRNLLQHETVDRNRTQSVQNKCSLFMATCLTLLEKDFENHVLQAAFKCLLDLLIILTNDFERLFKADETLKDFQFKLKDKEVTQLTDYARFYLFENEIEDNDNTEGCIEMKRILDAVMLGALPLEVLAELFRYYSSHYDKYGIVFDSALESIYSASKIGLSHVIYEILTTFYQELWSLHGDIQRSPESLDLKRLVVKFRDFYMIKKFDGKLEFMQLSIHFASTYQENFNFLYFVQTFATILSLQEVKLCLNQINSCHQNFKENDQTKRVVMSLKAISNDLRDRAQRKTRKARRSEQAVPESSGHTEHLTEESMYNDDQDLSEGIEDPDVGMETPSGGAEDSEEVIEDYESE